jgi:pimeloyl-ACP methyl ester carboxylesterase
MTPDELPLRHAYADVNGIRMHYVEKIGDKPEGPLALLLHGFPEMWWSWRYQIPALAGAGYRVIAPDLRGYNETDAKGPYDLDTLRDDVVALLDHLRVPNAVVVAHDWGGVLAWHLAGTRPERCAKLVIMNAPHPIVFGRALRRSVKQLQRSWYIFFFQLPILPERVLVARDGGGAVRALRGNALDKTHFNPEELEPFAEAVRKPGRATGMVNWYRAAMRDFVRPRRLSRRGNGRYAPVTVPSLLLWAMQDRALGYDDVVPGTEKYAPGLEIQKIEGCGHFIQQEQPEEVNRRLLEFLVRSGPSTTPPAPAA